jgi:hypothetical protein
MQDLLSKEDHYKKGAAEFSDLAKNAPSSFIRGYCQRIAVQYLILAQSELRRAESEDRAVSQITSAIEQGGT